MSHSFDLPFPVMRYTAWSTWRSSKESFRQRFYHGIEIPQTPQVVFGHKLAKEMESDDSIPGSETQITVTLRTRGNKTLKIRGHLDSFDEERRRIIEYKTGHADPNGKDRWDNLKVRKHKQLDFYSLIVKEKYGYVDPFVDLIWLETEWVGGQFDTGILSSEKKLQLTGRKEIFTRRIAEWERKNIKKDVFLAAAEIEEDYKEFRRQL